MKNRLRGVKGVLDGIRAIGSASQASKTDLDSLDFEENLKSEHFNIAKIVCHGFPNAPSCIAFDPIQKLLAIGTKNGSIRILGRAGVDCHLKLDKDESVKQLIFIVNEGGLISIGSDNTISLWTIRQKKPSITLQTQFSKREEVSQAYLPFQSKFVYIGTAQGNVYMLNVETFALSGYIINWNKVIGMMQSVHPGSVIHLSESPQDSSKLLIGFRKGLIVLWDLQKRDAIRFKHNEELHSASWHYEGRMFISCHGDGSLVKWSIKSPHRPMEVIFPHANLMDNEAATSSFQPIQRVHWLAKRKDAADLFLFSGGSPQQVAHPCVNVQIGTHIDVLQMEHPIIDIVPLCDTPFSNDMSEPYAVAVLQQQDLAVIDLTSDGYPNFENPYPMDLHESAVTACHYIADCPHKLIESYYMVGRAQKQNEGFSSKQWPITGGEWGDSKTSYSEILVTGHADGSLKFWDATLLELQALYRVRTSKYFDQPPVNQSGKGSNPSSRQTSHEMDSGCDERGGGGGGGGGGGCGGTDSHIRLLPAGIGDEQPFAIRDISFDADCQRVTAAASGHVCVMNFSRKERSAEILTVEACIESFDDSDLHEDFSKICSSSQQSLHAVNSQKQQQQQQHTAAETRELFCGLAVRLGNRRWPAGFQPELICRLASSSREMPPAITCARFSSEYQILAVGNENGVALVDLVQASVLLTLCTADLYGSLDSNSRNPRSPSGKKEDRQHSMEHMNGTQPNTPSATGAGSSASSAGPASPSFSSSSSAAAAAAASSSSNRYNRRLENSGVAAATQRAELKRARSQEKPDTFSRSCSSSTSSLDHVAKESIVYFAFADTFARRNDTGSSPCLWIGTSTGSVFIANLQLSPDLRTTQPVIVSPSGTVIRMLGGIQEIAFLDSIIPPQLPEQLLHEELQQQQQQHEFDKPLQPPPQGRKTNSNNPPINQRSGSSSSTSTTTSRDTLQRQSTTGSLGGGNDDKQLVCLCSEKQVRVMGLPSQACYAKKKLTETSSVVKATVPLVLGSPCLVCLLANGHVIVNSLPSLRPLMDIDFMPGVDFRISRTFQCSNHGQAVYLASPSELQKITLSSDMSNDLSSMLADLFIPCDLPEPPKKTLFEKVGQNLFGSGLASPLDRGQLFGDSAGKAAAGICKVTKAPNLDGIRARAEGASSEIGNALQKGLERGEKLGELDEQTERMKNSAEQSRSLAGQLAQKYKDKDKKWWPF